MNKKERSQYIKDLQSDITSIHSIPEEDRNDFELVKVQRELGRCIVKMGFDVLKQQFFIKESIPEIGERFNNAFRSFGELYDFAEGKIYDNACYFGYSFSEDEIAKYNLGISKMNFTSFVIETMKDIDIRKDKNKTEVSEKALKWKTLFFDSLNKLKNVSTSEEFAQTVEDFCIAEQKFGFYYRYSFNLDETACGVLLFNWLIHSKNIDLIPEEIWNGNYRKYVSHHFFYSLFIIFGEKLFDKLPKYQYTSGKQRYTSHYSRIRKFFATTPETEIKKGYDIQRDIYYINTEYCFVPENFKFCITTLYFESFDDFTAALNNDLSDCDLRNADLSQYDLSQYKTNANTKFGRNNISGSFAYKVIKGFNRRGFYILQELIDSSGNVISNKENIYEYFCDFLRVLGNDLSDCDLLFCDGLKNVPDILSYNLEKAKVTSETLIKAGKNEKDIVHINFPVVKKSTFQFALQNEKETKYVLSAMREKEYTLQEYRVLYISDLHLMHKIKNKVKSGKIQTANDVEFFLKSAVLQMLSSSSYYSPIIIAGDIATLPELYKWFIKFLYQKEKNVIVIPGNHELWSMSKENWHHELDEYRLFVEECGLVFLHNSIAYMCDDRKWKTISEEEIMNMSVEDIRSQTLKARYLIFGGLGFSGYNSKFNANNGVYQHTLDINSDIEETKKFEALYKKIEQCFCGREIIIATHTPVKDWLESAEYHDGWIYINGHNHYNYFYDDGVTRVYADNQLGYKNSNFSLKSISIDGDYDIFEYYSDGIHQIIAEQYRDFYRGKNMTMDFNRNDLDIFMLKKKGYYCFISQSQKMRSLCFLEGGRQKQLSVKDIQYYYDHMEEEIKTLEIPIRKFYRMQKKISELVKSIGGSGRIHGCIIDIDYYNHIYLNPHGNTLHCYFAYDIVKK